MAKFLIINNKLTKIRHRNIILLASILVFAIILRLVFFTGIGASDSLAYTRLAYDFGGIQHKEDLFLANRIGIFFPINFLYSAFGVNEFSSNILILVFSLASIVLTYKFGKLLFNEKVGILGAFLLSFFPLDVVYSTRLLTDLPSAFFVALSVYFFLKSEKIKDKARTRINLLLSGLALGIGHLIRETSLFIGLFFLIYVVYKRKIKAEYLLIALGFALVLSLELFYFLKATGDPFFRYTSVSKEISAIIATDNYGRGSLPFSLFHYPYIIFTDNLLGLFYPFIFIAVVYCILRGKKETYALLFWFIPILLYLSFGSESLTKYVPFPVASRFLFIINIPGLLLLSYFLSQKEQIIKRILMPSIIALLFVTSIGYIYISEHRFALADEKAAYKYLSSLPQKKIYSDSRTAAIFNYLSGYKADNFIGFNNYDLMNPENTYALDLSKIKDAHVAVNWDLIDFFISSKRGIKFPEEIYNVPENWILKESIARKGEKGIEIYYAP